MHVFDSVPKSNIVMFCQASYDTLQYIKNSWSCFLGYNMNVARRKELFHFFTDGAIA